MFSPLGTCFEKITIVVACIVLASGGGAALAASSGCYRWHSCPSATGSYVCGDTGHCSQCPDNRYCAGGLPRLDTPKPVPPVTDTPQASQTRSASSTEPFAPPAQTKTAGCAAQGGLPDHACTPGEALNVTAAQICKSGYSKSVRNVSAKTKNLVYKEYGIKRRTTGQYEVDHLIPLELGGSNDTANLWPEAAKPKPGFHEKDKVENWLHRQVCIGAMALGEAQREASTAWLDAYATMGGAAQKAKGACVGGCP